MYYLLAILLGLIILPMLLLRLRPIRLPRVRGVFYGRAVYALTCAAVNFQELRKVFAVGVRKRESASAVIYPEWITEMEAEIQKLEKRLNESALVLPFTDLYNDAIRMRQRVKEARTEVERQFKRSRTAGSCPGNSDEDKNPVSKGRAPPITPWDSVEQPKSQPQETTRPLRRTKLTVT